MSDASSDGYSLADQATPVGASAALFERSPQPMAAVQGTDSPRIQVVNHSYLERFDGRSMDDADRGSFRRRTGLSGTEREIVRTAADGTSASDSVTKRTADGRRPFTVRALPAPQAEVTAYLQYTDVTARRIRDQQLAVLRRVLRHDLRNDLTVLLGYAETIAQTSDDPEAREHAATVVDAASDLRAVAESAGRMQCVTATAKPTPLGEATARVRRSIAPAYPCEFVVDGAVPSSTVDSRIGIALEELCRTFADRGDAQSIELTVDADDTWTTITVDADVPLCEQERAALEGRNETKLRHATGISPWIARWAVRAAGGRLRVDPRGDGTGRVEIAAPVLDEDPTDAERTAWLEY